MFILYSTELMEVRNLSKKFDLNLKNEYSNRRCTLKLVFRLV